MPIDYESLEHELRTATVSAFEQLQEATAGQHIYAFGLYTYDEGLYLFATANTEEALRDERHRWSPCDWAYHEFALDLFDKVDQILESGWSEDFSRTSVEPDRVFDVALRVLKELSDEGMFGTGEERRKIVVNLLKGDQSDEERAEWAAMLNPLPTEAERRQR